jgi:hypothetical protein
VSHVERDDVRGAALEQHVGEPPGRGADVERVPAGHLDTELIQRVRELQTATANVRVVVFPQLDASAIVDGRAGFGGRTPVDEHLAGQDQRPRPLARRGQATVDDEVVEADTGQELSPNAECRMLNAEVPSPEPPSTRDAF